jgi:polysaccharide chain length determinant protein (PEP-CTERM system associated)
MTNQPDNLHLEVLLENASRWRWLFIAPFAVAMIVGMTLAVKMPRIYESATTILVQPQKVPENYVQSLVPQSIEDRIRTIQQQILSWSNLEKVIERHSLYASEEQKGMLPEEKIESLREHITIDVIQGIGGRPRGSDAAAFSVAFRANDPRVAMNVANSLASYFIDENLKNREDQAMGTSSFLEDELSVLRRRLLETEETLKEYRSRNMGVLPEQLQTNLSILGQLQADLLEKQKALREAKTAVVLLEEQVRTTRVPGKIQPQASQGPESELSLAKKQLEEFKSRYTDQHPDVLRLQRKVAEMEASAPSGPQGPPAAVQSLAGREYQAFVGRQRAQINQLKAGIASLELDIEGVRKQIELYQKRVEETPKSEQALFSLNRDYENLKNAYNSLLTRKLEADLSVNMEKKQKSEQFQILDVARLPERPISPNVPKIFAISVAGGLGIGAGLVFLLALLDRNVRRPEEVEKLVGVPVLVAIPSIARSEDRRRMRRNQLFTMGGILFCSALCGAFGLLAIKGVDRTMDFVSRVLG